MPFIIEADYSRLERELDRIEHTPSLATLTELEAALAQAFAETTARVHVITGALRGSGKTATDSDDDSWQGQMTWGGPSPGFLPKPPPLHPHHEAHPAEDQRAREEVVYAWYEKRRGGSHNYLAGQDQYTEEFKRIFEASVRGR